MKNKDLVKELASRMNWSISDVSVALIELGSIVSSRLSDGDSVYLEGLGQFETRKKGERISVNPANGKRYLVPPKLVPVFKPGVTIKTQLKELGNNE
jgi:DNA-binding protein HU-beta